MWPDEKWKSARRCGPKRISKSKCTKHIKTPAFRSIFEGSGGAVVVVVAGWACDMYGWWWSDREAHEFFSWPRGGKEWNGEIWESQQTSWSLVESNLIWPNVCGWFRLCWNPRMMQNEGVSPMSLMLQLHWKRIGCWWVWVRPVARKMINRKKCNLCGTGVVWVVLVVAVFLTCLCLVLSLNHGFKLQGFFNHTTAASGANKNDQGLKVFSHSALGKVWVQVVDW